jgi:hypothetical protein
VSFTDPLLASNAVWDLCSEYGVSLPLPTCDKNSLQLYDYPRWSAAVCRSRSMLKLVLIRRPWFPINLEIRAFNVVLYAEKTLLFGMRKKLRRNI